MGTAQAFVGRASELAALGRAFATVRDGRSAFVLIDGTAGIGKTALITRFLAELVDARVLQVSGDETEAEIPFAALEQILGQLPRPAGSQGFSQSLAVADPVGAGAQLLGAVGAALSDEPLVLVVDDVQWLDSYSLRALLFALRRLLADRVLTLMAARSEDLPNLPDGLRRLARRDSALALTLAPLGSDELRALAASLGVTDFPARAAHRLAEHTDGNPLHALALLTELPREVWRGPLSVLPPPRSFEAMIVERLGRLGDGARALIEAAAVLGLRSPLELIAALAGGHDPLSALDEAFAAGILCDDAAGDQRVVRFVHPLIQAAVYAQLAPGARVRLHRAAAALATDEALRLRHRAAAALTGDPELARELEAFAARQTARGAWAHAAASLIAASRVSHKGPDAERLVLKAVDSMLYHGDVAQASGYADEVTAMAPGPRRDCVLGFLAILRSSPLVAEEELRRAWEGCDAVADPQLAATIARRNALHFLNRARGEQTMLWSTRARQLGAADADGAGLAEMLPLGVGEGYRGHLEVGLELLDQAITEAERSFGGRRVSVRRTRGWLRSVGDDLRGALADLFAESDDALRIGSPGTAAFSLAQLARVEYLLGAWDQGAVHAERAVVITAELEHPLLSLAVLAEVEIAAARGDFEASEERLRLVRGAGYQYELNVAFTALAGAHLAAARGDAAEVIVALSPIAELDDRAGLDEPGFFPWQALYADALTALRRFDEAERLLAEHEALAAERERGSVIARLARAHGRLLAATGRFDAAEASFKLALERLEGLSMPFETALTRLAVGQALRRRGQRKAAAAQLSAANATFIRLHARPYRSRCEVALRACGLTPARRAGFDRDCLTPQELTVARLVASGRTNRQVASELVLSVHTIEFHLTRIYAKLGITSRAQLASLVGRDQGQPPPTRGSD